MEILKINYAEFIVKIEESEKVIDKIKLMEE